MPRATHTAERLTGCPGPRSPRAKRRPRHMAGSQMRADDRSAERRDAQAAIEEHARRGRMTRKATVGRDRLVTCATWRPGGAESLRARRELRPRAELGTRRRAARDINSLSSERSAGTPRQQSAATASSWRAGGMTGRLALTSSANAPTRCCGMGRIRRGDQNDPARHWPALLKGLSATLHQFVQKFAVEARGGTTKPPRSIATQVGSSATTVTAVTALRFTPRRLISLLALATSTRPGSGREGMHDCDERGGAFRLAAAAGWSCGIEDD